MEQADLFHTFKGHIPADNVAPALQSLRTALSSFGSLQNLNLSPLIEWGKETKKSLIFDEDFKLSFKSFDFSDQKSLKMSQGVILARLSQFIEIVEDDDDYMICHIYEKEISLGNYL